MAEIGKDINKAKELLEAGKLVAIPTETVYGLAANALNAEAVTGIFTAKNRPFFDPLIVHVASLDQANRYIKSIPAPLRQLAESYWPGPLTLLVERGESIPDLVTSGLSTVGIRCPSHPLTRELLELTNFPLAAPSANPFGYVSPTTPAHVADQLGDRIPYILDGGPCTVGIESTIVGIEQGKCAVYRMGGLDVEAIEEVVGKIELKTSSSNPKAPGQLQSHYAPRKKVITGNIEELVTAYRDKTIGILSFQRDHHTPHQVILSPAGSPFLPGKFKR